MTEREELRESIAKLEGEKALLSMDEKVLNNIFWACPTGLFAQSIDSWLGDICDRLDAISDELGPLKDRLYEIDADQSRREMLADASYGRTL